MPLTTTRRGPADPHRRSVLTGAAALGAAALLAGCSAHQDGAEGDKRAAVGARLRARAARDSTALLERYEATLAAHAGLAGRLTPLRAEVALHARAFGAREKRATGSSTPSASSSASTSPASPTSPSTVSSSSASSTSSASPTADTDVPRDEKGALGALADAERRTADAHLAALADAPPELARLLASVAAAGAAHVYLLTEGS
ncbi:hypothetical protein AB0A77_35125 [Streptomyces varsoviensis]|uniref:hypothetical protein n=1 Tax=Streptomyces varsoviensis TaxID=67373 RepID=UPI0033E58F5B